MIVTMMKAEVRFLAWFGIATALSFLTASNFVALLDLSLGDTFGSVFPAIPFAALLALILALRWSDLKEVLVAEGGFASQSVTRLLGLVIVGALLVLRPITAQTVEASGIALVLTFYGSSLVMNPLTRRFMLPYAGVCAIGVGAPTVLQLAFGEPLATLSSDLSARMVGLAGFPVSWQGTQFELVSKSGEVLTGAVTPGCSSIISVTTFLGLLALMHLDLRKDLRSTTILAIAGVAFLTLLNSVRILILLWVGYEGGAATFWGVHNWIGYALFLGFYLAALPIYSRMGRGPLGFYPGRTGKLDQIAETSSTYSALVGVLLAVGTGLVCFKFRYVRPPGRSDAPNENPKTFLQKVHTVGRKGTPRVSIGENPR